jgi:TonB family protein
MMFKVKIDDTGKVTSVDIMKSSGSNNIDLPMRRALYEWWIEPPKDKDGKATADVMTWTISYR